MDIIEILIVGLGLSMDAFAVAIGKGLTIHTFRLPKALIVGAYFGIFQGIMPIAGFLLGESLGCLVSYYANWVVFFLLTAIGIRTIMDGFHKDEKYSENLGAREMLPLSIATSIDALALGITFSLLEVPILKAASIITVITFFVSIIGVRIGCIFGMKYKKQAELFGGIILIVIGAKILLESLIG